MRCFVSIIWEKMLILHSHRTKGVLGNPTSHITMSENIITSTQNPKVRLLLTLQQKSSERRARELFVVEGVREVSHCQKSGLAVETLFYCPALLDDDEAYAIINEVPSSRRFQVTQEVYAKMAYRSGTEGIMAEVKPRKRTLGDLSLGTCPLIVVLESVEKPGNLGAVLRSADAANADAVIICDPLTDLYNPNLIRSSLGAVFTVPCVACTSEECINFLKEKGVRILTAQLQDSHLYYDTDMTTATALVMGKESTGLSEQWRRVADAHIRIPMMGRLDSLNVSVSTAILLFEAVRQRLSHIIEE